MLNLKIGEYVGKVTSAYHTDAVVVTRTEYRSSVMDNWHNHARHHISLIWRGGNNEERKTARFDALPGTVIAYNAGEIHRNKNTADRSCIINLEIKDEFYQLYALPQSSFNQQLDKSGQTLFPMLQIYKECLTNDSLSPDAIHSNVLSLLSELTSCQVVSPNPAWVKKIKELLHDRFADNLSLSEIAGLLQLHPVTVSRFFPRYFKCTLSEYQRRLRVQQAFSLMKTTQLSLTEIAYSCGFCDQSHFTKNFQRLTGFLPKKIQKQ